MSIGDRIRMFRLILSATWKARSRASRVSRCPVGSPDWCICEVCNGVA